MLPLNRREIIAGTAASGLAPAAASAYECLRSGMNWETMSLEQRDLAYNSVAAVGADCAKMKAEEWVAASKVLRQKPVSIAYGTDELPFMIASSRDCHAYRSERHLSGDWFRFPIEAT
jgi:hypothetical protein